MTISDLTLCDITTVVENIIRDYERPVSFDDVDKVLETFYNIWDDTNDHYGVKGILFGLDKTEAYFYNSLLHSLVMVIVHKSMFSVERYSMDTEKNYSVDLELPY